MPPHTKKDTVKALFLIDDGFEDLELLCPYFRLLEEGIEAYAASSDKKTKTGKHGYTYTPELTYDEIDVSEYDMLILPGGKAPETIRTDKKAVDAAKKFMDMGKIVAAICHGPQILISANALKGRKATAYKGIIDDLKQAGAITSDEEVVVDGNLITSRKPEDLPAYMRELMRKVK